jgi:hypothetical protein
MAIGHMALDQWAGALLRSINFKRNNIIRFVP